MTKRMLIDATHAEEIRVVVLDGNRLEDFDVETSTKKQLKGNIYLAKVVRVEPSLQAAFVEYGGGRHGFLAFDEIHPDYYQIPVADRQRLIEMQAAEAREDEEEEDRAAEAAEAGGGENETTRSSSVQPAAIPDAPDGAPEPVAEPEPEIASSSAQPAAIPHEADAAPTHPEAQREIQPEPEPATGSSTARAAAIPQEVIAGPAFAEEAEPDHAGSDADALQRHAEFASLMPVGIETPGEPDAEPAAASGEAAAAAPAEPEAGPDGDGFEPHNEPAVEQLPPPETVGGEGDPSEERDRRIPPRFLRNYKIQEVIKRRQILLVQVVKEERGTKGAALTTYISLAGRYCVLMPNSPRGGGISRKITSAADRRRLKEITAELEIPRGMGLIVRTAGANRPKPEIKRDCEYLMRLWDDIREHTMRSVAPALIYEEASLIKRSIRDVYSRDLDEIVVDGEDGWKAARDFMRMLMPSHAKKVQLWRDGQSLFARHQVDAQLDAMMSPTVQLKSGGYLVINQAEALVAIDVNSGRSTRDRGIEETAVRTNLEAADEVARQLRLRDLAGLIVIDFIDMESKKNNAMVERRMKEALKNDRARIQVGHISHFGLLEMSRQRLRPSLAETSLIPCPHCGGSGHVRSTESAAVHVLRQIEEEGAKRRSAEIVVHAATAVAMYILNHKRERLAEIEVRHGLHVTFAGDDALIAPQIRIDRVRAAVPSELPPAVTPDALPAVATPPEDDTVADEEPDVSDEDDEAEQAEDAAASVPAAAAAGGMGEEGDEAERRRRRRRRRRRGGRREDGAATQEGAEVGSPPVEVRAVQPQPAGLQSAGSMTDAQVETDAQVADAANTPWPLEGVPERADDAGTPPTAEEEPGRPRGRSRRGGRRRRREGDDSLLPLAEPGAAQPELPAYTGPTPANPFGGQAFDIFDLIDGEANHQPAPAPDAAAPEPQPIPELAPEPIAAPAAVEALPGAEAAPNSVPAPDPVEPATAAEPELVSAPTAAPVAAEATHAPEPANDTASEPVVKPILVGAESEPVVEKKRGWWRR